MGLFANPLVNPEAFDVLVISGVASPGLFRLVDGGGRPYKWDVKDTSGAQGATQTYRGLRPSEGINGRFEFWTPEQIDEFFARFLPLLKYDGTKKNPLPVSAQHPVLSANDITQLVTDEIGPLVDLGEQLWSVTVKFMEYRPAKKANVTSTPAKLTPEADKPPDAVYAQNNELDGLLSAAAKEAFSDDEKAAAGAPVPQPLPPPVFIKPDFS